MLQSSDKVTNIQYNHNINYNINHYKLKPDSKNITHTRALTHKQIH